MSYQIEVCIDNLESLHHAIAGGATRIELCSSLALGGLTPSFGMMKMAVQLSSIPIYAMIRPRQGDFLYNSDDIDSMIEDIHAAATAGVDGIVFGVLKADASIDMRLAQRIMTVAAECQLGVTFHRAIDQCVDYSQAIEDIASLGCERILTSGLASTAAEGIDVLKKMVIQADGRFDVMAGAGVTADNALLITQQTGIKSLHLSGKSIRASHMTLIANQAKMGSNDTDDFVIPVTDSNAIARVVTGINAIAQITTD